MITIHLTGNDNDVQKAVFVLQQLFEGVQVEQGDSPGKQDTYIHLRLVAQNLPDNQALLALMKTSAWQTAMDEIWNLYKKPVIHRDELKRLRESIEAGSQLAADFEEAGYKIEQQTIDAMGELERIEGEAVGYILNATHPALKSE